MNTFSRLLTTATASLALLTGGGAALAASTPDMDSAPAAVRDHCVGVKQKTHVLKNGYNNKIGRVELWYSSRKGGQRCVMTYNYITGKTLTQAFLYVKRKNGNYYVTRDVGRFEYYAGGTYQNHTDGRCYSYSGRVDGKQPNKTKDDAYFISDDICP